MRNKGREQQITRFYNLIDPARPISFDKDVPEEALDGDKVYVSDLHEDGFDVPRKSLQKAIVRTASADRYFFSGMRGSGKTTELRRLQHDLAETGEWVVFYTDMSEYLPLNAAVEIGDFLLVVVSALADEVHLRYGEDFKSIGPIARFVQFLASEVQIEGLEWSIDTLLGKLGLKAKIKDNPSFQQELQQITRRRIDRIVAESRAFIDGLVDYVRGRWAGSDTRVLYIVDSVERLQGIGDEAKKVFDSVENLFNAHRDKLRFNTLDVVYSVPPHISAATAAGAGRVYSLPMIRVFDRPPANSHGAPSQAGVGKMLQVLDLRCDYWRGLISEEHMRELARVSGGDLRELFSLARETLNLLDPDDDAHFPAPAAAIEQCKKLRRNQFGLIPVNHMDWLKRVAETHGHALPSIEELGTLAQLFDGKLILKYRNGEDWYDVHPLLWEQVDRHVVATP
jgi:hypothetical protein